MEYTTSTLYVIDVNLYAFLDLIVCPHISLTLHRGATCYMNSLIQALYMSPYFRHKLFSIDSELLGVNQYMNNKNSQEVKDEDIQPDNSMWACSQCTVENVCTY